MKSYTNNSANLRCPPAPKARYMSAIPWANTSMESNMGSEGVHSLSSNSSIEGQETLSDSGYPGWQHDRTPAHSVFALNFGSPSNFIGEKLSDCSIADGSTDNLFI